IVKEQFSLSTKRRNFNSQFGVENSSYELTSIGNPPIANRQCHGGGEGIRTPDPRVANAVLCQLSYTPDKISHSEIRISKLRRGWLRGRDLNPRPLGYEPNELPDCSTPRQSYYHKTHDIRNLKFAFRNLK